MCKFILFLLIIGLQFSLFVFGFGFEFVWHFAYLHHLSMISPQVRSPSEGLV